MIKRLLPWMVRVVIGSLVAVAVSAPSGDSTEGSPARAASDLTVGEAVECVDWDTPSCVPLSVAA